MGHPLLRTLRLIVHVQGGTHAYGAKQSPLLSTHSAEHPYLRSDGHEPHGVPLFSGKVTFGDRDNDT